MGKIFNALEKYKKERSASGSPGRLRSADCEVLLKYDRTSGSLDLKNPVIMKKEGTLRRLQFYRLILADGTLTPAGLAKCAELENRRKSTAANSPDAPLPDKTEKDKPELVSEGLVEAAIANGESEEIETQAAVVAEKIQDSDWDVLSKYDRNSGHLLKYNQKTGQLDNAGIEFLRNKGTLQRLLDSGMIYPGGKLTPLGIRECQKREADRRESLPADTASASSEDASILKTGSGNASSEPAEIEPSIRKILEGETIPLHETFLMKSTERQRGQEETPAADKSREFVKGDDVDLVAIYETSDRAGAGIISEDKLPGAISPALYNENAIDKKIVSLLKPHSFEAEQFKILRTNLLYPISGKAPRSVLVSSTAPGEGKSFVTANLAISIANDINRYVLLIDCDLRRPTIHYLFGFGDVPGLGDYLSKGTPLDSLLLRTPVQKLSILPAGKPPDNPSELLSSKKMSALLEEVSTRYSDRIIIIDSPPPKLTAETHVLASQVDGVLIVLKYGSTRKELVNELIDKFGSNKILGAVMNDFDIRSSGYHTKYYGKYYGKQGS